MKEIKAKKSLGQNFLHSNTALNKMLEAGAVTSNDTILEIGPGKGVLTEKLLATGARVIAIEKDHRLIKLLQEKFEEQIKTNRFRLIESDVLEIIPQDIGLKTHGYKIIANIPYYITGQFMRKFLESNCQPERIVVMVQKEIAQRIVAKDKNGNKTGPESLLSISVKVYGEPKLEMKVGKENFSPAPKVDSAILSIKNISKKLFTESGVAEDKFFELIHVGFAHKRKTLAGNLKNFYNIDYSTKISDLKLDAKVRAEELRVEEWMKLSQE